MIYLDSAATSFQKPPQVERAMLWALKNCASVGRGGYEAAEQAARTVFACREKAAALFDCKPEQVVFTSCATHGLNIAIGSLVRPGERVLISGFEHNAVTRPLHGLGADIIVAGRRLFSPEDTLEAFEQALRTRPKAAVCTQVSNVFGYMLPIEEVAALCKAWEVPLVIDASQGAGILPLSLKKSAAAFIAMPGHKGLLGPQGTGLLLCGAEARPLLYGGTGGNSLKQEMPDFLPDRLEAGTHNVCGIAGLSAGLSYVAKRRPEEILRREQALLGQILPALRELPQMELFTGRNQSGVLSFRIRGEDCEEWAQRFARAGASLRAGLHCAPLAHKSAGTLESGTLRLSFSPFHTSKDAREFVLLCKKLCR